MKTKWIRRILMTGLYVMLASCVSRQSTYKWPMDEKLINDVSPLSPPDSKSLKSYALTLPIFEMTDQSERIEWVSRWGLRIESPNEIVLTGDGAQDDVAIQRISSVDSPLQKIRVTIAVQGDGPDRIYDLIRVPGGWKRVGMKRERGAWDKIYQRSKAERNMNNKAEQVVAHQPA